MEKSIKQIACSTVNSSNIESIGHCPETNTLEVNFKNGTGYQYSNFTADHHKELMSADSLGSHFHRNVKGNFQYVRVR